MARPLRVNVEGNPSGIRRALGLSVADVKKSAAQISREKFEVKIDADIRAAETKTALLRERLEELRRRPASVKVDADTAAAKAQLAALDIRLDRLRRERVEVKVDVDSRDADRNFTIFGAKVKKTAVAATAAVAGIGIAVTKLTTTLSNLSNLPILLTLAQGLSQVAGAAALLPAVLGAGAAAFGTIKLATAGFSDALKAAGEDQAKFDEAVKGLAPSVRETAVAVRELLPTFQQFQQAVAQPFFAGFATTVRELTATLLPGLTAGLGSVAAAMNASAVAAAKALMTPESVAAVNRIVDATAESFRALAPAVGDVVTGLLAVGRVGADFLPGLADGVSEVASRFREWAVAAAEAGRIEEIISRALSVIGDLGQMAGNIGGIIQGVFRAIGVDGAGLIATLQQLTAQALAWVNSAAGQEKIAQIFDSLSKIAFALAQILPHVAGAVSTLAGWFSNLSPTMQSVVGGFVGWGALLGPIVTKLSPLVGLVVQFGAKIASVLLPNIRWLGSSLLTMGGQALLAGAKVAAGWVAAMGPVAWVIAAVVALVALIILNWDTVKRVTVEVWNAAFAAVSNAASQIVSAVSSALSSAAAAVQGAWNQVWTATQNTWNQVYAAVADAVGWVRAQIDTLADIPGRVGAFFSAAAAQASAALGQLVASVRASASEVIASFRSGWNQTIAVVRSAASTLLGVVRAIPGQITSALGNLSSLLVPAGRNLIQGLISGIVAMAKAAAAAAVKVVKDAAAAAWAAIKPGSPSKLTRPMGVSLGQGVGAGIIAKIPAVEAAAAELVVAANRSATAALAGLGTVELTVGGLRVSANLSGGQASAAVSSAGFAASAGTSGTRFGRADTDIAVELRAIRELLERRGAGAEITVEDRSGDPVETARAVKLALRLA